MTTLKTWGTLLSASADDRTLSYRLLPYGEEGRTSLGRVTASKGVVTLPEDASTLVANMEHDGTKPVARFVSLEESDEGLDCTVRVLNTTAGNDLLIEAAEGVRTGISVEIEEPVIRKGALLGGTLTGAGFVTQPAFPSAQLVAADAGDLPEGFPEWMLPSESTSESTEEIVGSDGVTYVITRKSVSTTTVDPKTTDGEVPSEEAAPAAENEEEVGNSTATAAAPAAAPQGLQAASTPSAPAVHTKGSVFKMLAEAYRVGGERKLRAALADIVPADILGIDQGQFVGELWSGKAYERRYVPLFNHADLTSFEVKGWRWVTKPVVAAYAGGKTAVPSAAVETEPVAISAEQIAGAHDIDRKFRDFGDVGFWEAYYRAMTESYAKVSDVKVLTDVLTAATEVEVGATVGDTPEVLTKIVDGALAVIDAYATPSFAVVSSDLYRPLLFTKQSDVLGYLNMALGLESGDLSGFRIQSDSTLAAGTVLVGAREAVTVHELPGNPIRVEAENIALGGVDAGVFGYYAVNVHDAEAIVSVIDAAEG